MNLSEHFTLEELSVTEHREFLDDNALWAEEHKANLKRLCDEALEPVRELAAAPVLITSGARCPGLNAAVGGSDDSAHMDGRAADCTAPGFAGPLGLCRAVVGSPIPFDQLIYEGRWMHIGITRDGLEPRRQVLTAIFTKDSVTGRVRTSYRVGLPS